MFESYTPEQIKAQILAAITEWDVQEGSVVNTLVSGAAYEIWSVYQIMDALVPIFYVDETSGSFIDAKCAEYGIARKAGTKATVMLTLTGNDGVVIPAGTAFFTASGLCFYLDAETTISSGTADSSATAALVGAQYNVAANTIISVGYSISGLTATTNASAATGGTDAETDAALVARLYAHLRKPPTSGNAYHYEQWALEVDGVGHVKVMPLWDGAGTVKVLLADADAQPVTAEVVEAVEDHIASERPIGATVTVASATALAINVTAAVTVTPLTTAAAVQAAFEALLAEYLGDIVFEATTIPYTRVLYLLLSIDGVTDVPSMTVNGGTANITVQDTQAPVVGTVVIS